MESGSIPILEGPIDSLMLPLSWYMPNDPHPFPVLNNGRWDVHLLNVLHEVLLSPSSSSLFIDTLQKKCQIWWNKFKVETSSKVFRALNTIPAKNGDNNIIQLKQNILNHINNHAFYILFQANEAYDGKNYDQAVLYSLKAINLELPYYENTGIPSIQLIEALIIALNQKSNTISITHLVSAYSRLFPEQPNLFEMPIEKLKFKEVECASRINFDMQTVDQLTIGPKYTKPMVLNDILSLK